MRVDGQGVADPLDSGLRDVAPIGAPAKPPARLNLPDPLAKRSAAAPTNVARLNLPDPLAKREAAIKANQLSAREIQPKAAAEHLQQLAMTGMPADAAAAMPGIAKQAAIEAEERAFAERTRKNPALSMWAAKNPHRMAIAQADLEQLSAIEWGLTGGKAAWTTGKQQAQLSDLGGLAWAGKATQADEELIAKLEEAMSITGDAGATSLGGEMLGGTLQVLPLSMQNIGRSLREATKIGLTTGMAAGGAALATGPAAAITAPAALLTGFKAGFAPAFTLYAGINEGMAERNLAYLELRKVEDENGRRLDPAVVKTVAQGIGIANGMLGAAQVRILTDSIPGLKGLTGFALRKKVIQSLKTPAVRDVLVANIAKFAGALAGETTIEAGQRAMNLIGEQIARQQSGMEGISTEETASDLAGEAKGAAKAFPLMLLPGAAINTVIDVQKARGKEINASGVLRQAGEAFKAAKFANAVPSESADFIRDAAERAGRPTVYTPFFGWTSYWQSKGEDPQQMAEQVGVSKEAYEEAEATGGRLGVPTDQWVTKIGPTIHNEALADSVAFDAGQLTDRELEELADLSRETQAELDATEIPRTPLDDFRDNLVGQLQGIGYTPAAAEFNAALVASAYGSFAERSGIAHEAWRQRFDPIIQRDLPGLRAIGRNSRLESMIWRLQQGHWVEDKDLYGKSLLEFIAAKGGMWDDGGEMKARDMTLRGRKAKGGTNPMIYSRKGLHIDYMRELAADYGYLSHDSDLNDFWDRIDEELNGNKQYSLTETTALQTKLQQLQHDMAGLADELEYLKIDLGSGTPQEIAVKLQEASKQQERDQEGALEQSVYHGSPHKFDKFDLSKIGTGEGAQAYGWGMYFAENPKVAGSYRDHLSGGSITHQSASAEANAQINSVFRQSDYEGPQDITKGWLSEVARQTMEGGDDVVAGEIAQLDPSGFKKTEGALYEVDIPDEAIGRMLDWDKPLSEQPESVRKALADVPGITPKMTGQEVYNTFAAAADPADGRSMAHMARLGAQKQRASAALNARGIPGLRYLDSGSRSSKYDYDEVVSEFGGGDERKAIDSLKRKISGLGKSEGPKMLKARMQLDAVKAGKQSRNIVLFDDKLATITGTMFQKAGQTKRGGIAFQNGQAIITMFEASDRSTFLHESGHLFLEMLRFAAAQPNAPQQIKDDMAALLKWFKLTSADQITTKHHEQFAEGFEKYLADGKAPSTALEDAFAAFAAWLKRVYRGVMYSGVRINDDVRGVMDRMLATDEEITHAQAARGDFDLYSEIEGQKLLDPEHLKNYRDRLRRASDERKADLTARLLKASEKASEDWWKAEREKVEAEITKRIHKDPAYIALQAIKYGQRPDGTAIKTTKKLKLNAKEITALYGKTTKKGDDTPNDVRNRLRGMVEDDGMPLSIAATVYGYGSGDALVQAITNTLPIRDAIQQETDREMLERYPDERFDGTLAIEAAQQVDGWAMRHELIAAEMAALRKIAAEVNKTLRVEDNKRRRGMEKVLRITITPQEARHIARLRIEKKKVGEIRSEQYRRTARMHAIKAIKAVGRKEYDVAYQNKVYELINNAMFEEARLAEKSILKMRERLVGYTKKSARARIGKAGEKYLAMLDSLLMQINLVPRTKIELSTFDYMRNVAGDGKIEGMEIPPAFSGIVSGSVQPYQSMTLLDFTMLYEDAVQIATLAGLANKLLQEKRKEELDAVTSTLADEVHKNKREGRSAAMAEMRLPGYQGRRSIKGYLVEGRNFASWVYEVFDGLQDNGFGFKYLTEGMQRASDRQAQLNHDMYKAMKKIMGRYTMLEWKSEMYEPRLVAGTNISLSRVGRIMVLLNAGNEHNKRVLMEGGLVRNGDWQSVALTEEELQAIINSLDERDIEFAKDVWSYIDTFFDDIMAIEKKVRGIAPPRVQPIQVRTSFGFITGGYMPISRESRQGQSEASHDFETDQQSLLSGSGRQFMPLPDRSMTHERKAGAKHGPLRLDFGAITGHLSAVAHYLSFYEYVMDAGRIIGDAKVRSAVKAVYGDQIYNQLVNALRAVSQGDAPAWTQMEGFSLALRTSASVSSMAFNMLTAATQLLGIMPGLSRVGPKWMARGLFASRRGANDPITAAKNAESVREWVDSSSTFMRNRKSTYNREVSEIMSIAISPSLIKRFGRNSVRLGYFMMLTMQRQVDLLIWMGAYEKAIAAKSDGGLAISSHEDAVLFADRQVRDTQGSGQLGDLSEIMRGSNTKKLLTTMFTYQNTVAALAAEETNRARKSGDVAGYARLFGAYTLILSGSVLQPAMYAAIRGDWDDKEADEILSEMARDAGAGVLSMYVGFRELASAISWGRNYRGPAGTKTIGDVSNLVYEVGDVTFGEGEVDESFLKALIRAGSAVNLPSTALWRLYQAFNGESDARPAWMVALAGEPVE